MRKDKKILVVTNSYPALGTAEKGFLIEDLRALLASGFSVTLLPIRICDKIDPDLPDGIDVDCNYAKSFSPGNIVGRFGDLLLDKLFWGEVLGRPKQALLYRFWKESIRISVGRKVFRRYLERFDVFYTHWFTADTAALACAGARPLITRAHGYDLYEEIAVNSGHIPYRRQLMDRVDRIIVLSEAAKRYVIDRYGISAERILRNSLGVSDQEHYNEGRLTEAITFVSCSSSAPVKRLRLIADALAAFARARPNLKVTWHHLGASERQIGIEGFAAPANMNIQARPAMPREQVLDFYTRNEVSFFINLSSSEGMPFAMMEAMSFGVPVIATAVGGVPEAVGKGGGVLVPVDASADAIAQTINNTIRQPDWRARLGAEARLCQRAHYSAKKNSQAFASFAASLCE
ncbi:glycosyltransferase [Pseudaminobacter salicylatoxidans]|uniref:glycosyltransferase n=1 Tax=Pseudaminobacter salicylatoxidans TaxID=93369 RepID=UPI00030D41CC|nr:glycosyltransferase [Pseudaminobacter salicylatoxidans]